MVGVVDYIKPFQAWVSVCVRESVCVSVCVFECV